MDLLFKSLLIFVVSLVSYMHSYWGSTMANRPIIVSTLVGLVLGDIKTGIIIGSALELAFLGAVPIGASNPPDMTSGAAIATLIARVVEFLLIIYVVYVSDRQINIGLKNVMSVDVVFIKRILKVAYPVLLNEIVWGLGAIFYLFVFSKYGSRVIVGYQISYQFYIMIESFMIGFALASQVLIGKAIGELRSQLKHLNETDPKFKQKTEELEIARYRYRELQDAIEKQSQSLNINF